MSANKSYVILFSGYSVNNTPKLKNLINSLKKEGYRVFLFGIVKDLSHDLADVNTTHLYSKGEKQGIVKIVIVSYYVLKLIFALVFKLKNSNIYSINPVSGIVAFISCALSSKQYIYESHEMVFGLDYPYFRGRWRHFWRILEKNIIRKAKYFFTTDSHRLKFIRRYYKIKGDNIGYILNVPRKRKVENEKEKNRKKFNFERKFVVSYCGGIIRGRGIESIIEAYANFRHRGSQTLLLLAGSIENDYLEVLNKMISKMGISSNEVLFTGKLNNSILMRYMSASDATFALYNDTSLNNRMCSPNKIFEAVHSKTYLITTNSFLTANIVSKNNIGVILKTITSQNIISAIEKCYEKKNNHFNEKKWDALQFKFSWESEFERVKSHILI